MSSNLAVDSLLIKRQQLLDEKIKMLEKYNGEIEDLERAIEILSGKKSWELQSEILYDDEHPDYIKASQEEI